MDEKAQAAVAAQIAGHQALEDVDYSRLRTMSMAERGRLLEAACEAAMEIERCRIAAGLPPSQPAPWPESTWAFLKEHAARVRK